MKYLNIFILVSMAFSACVFSEKPKIEYSQDITMENKEIFLNIQKLDITHVIPYKVLDSRCFKPCLKDISRENFYIDMFYLKEVNTDFIVFGTELCSFDKSKRVEVDVLIDEKGIINYKYQGWI